MEPTYAIRTICEKYNTDTGEVVSKQKVYDKIIEDPDELLKLGYRHHELIDISKGHQDFLLPSQSILISNKQNKICPKCNGKTRSEGTKESNFHTVFSDHKISIIVRSCKCGWRSDGSVLNIYGNSLHPDLALMQTELAAEGSFQAAAKKLHKYSKSKRRINNDDRVKKTSDASGVELFKLKQKTLWSKNKEKIAANSLILNIDGGHIKSKVAKERSFESLIATVYRPENLKSVDKNHNKIINKTSVGCSLEDKVGKMKKLVNNACKKQGLTKKTVLTLLADGAKNCWACAELAVKNAKETIKILDWFHIKQKFDKVYNTLDDDAKSCSSKAKWCIWNGNVEKAIIRLQEAINISSQEEGIKKIKAIMQYLKNNKDYIVNYSHRKAKNLPYTSTLAESSVNSLINVRQKKSQQMQWSRKGANNILQIRASIFSGSLLEDWNQILPKLYNKFA